MTVALSLPDCPPNHHHRLLDAGETFSRKSLLQDFVAHPHPDHYVEVTAHEAYAALNYIATDASHKLDAFKALDDGDKAEFCCPEDGFDRGEVLRCLSPLYLLYCTPAMHSNASLLDSHRAVSKTTWS